MIGTRYCGTAAKADGSGEERYHTIVRGVSLLLTMHIQIVTAMLMFMIPAYGADQTLMRDKEVLGDRELRRADPDKLYAAGKLPQRIAESSAKDGEIIFAERNPGRDYQVRL